MLQSCFHLNSLAASRTAVHFFNFDSRLHDHHLSFACFIGWIVEWKRSLLYRLFLHSSYIHLVISWSICHKWALLLKSLQKSEKLLQLLDQHKIDSRKTNWYCLLEKKYAIYFGLVSSETQWTIMLLKLAPGCIPQTLHWWAFQ